MLTSGRKLRDLPRRAAGLWPSELVPTVVWLRVFKCSAARIRLQSLPLLWHGRLGKGSGPDDFTSLLQPRGGDALVCDIITMKVGGP